MPRSRSSAFPRCIRRSRSCSRRWRRTCSATRRPSRSTPRRGRCVRRGRRSSQRSRPRSPTTRSFGWLTPMLEPRGAALLRRAAGGLVQRPSRGEHRGAGVVAVAVRHRRSRLDAYQIEHGKVGTPSVVIEDLSLALTRGVEELTRPVDAIKHQAKTVTVGISRSDETLLRGAARAGGARRRRPTRPAQLPHAAHAGRARPRRRRGHRLHPLPRRR